MLKDFIFAFLGSLVGYGLASAIVIFLVEGRQRQRVSCLWRATLRTLNRAVDVINFVNALIASTLSSWALYYLEGRYHVRGGRTNSPLADVILGTVCGYIAVEIGLVSLTCLSHVMSGNRAAWTVLKQVYAEMLLFHVVAFVGLTSVVFRNTGYPLALWVVWSELTSVFIGLQNFTEGTRHTILRQTAVFCGACAAVLFVLQRVAMFYYLLWLSWRDFVWETGFICQFGVLLAGTLLNTHLAWEIII